MNVYLLPIRSLLVLPVLLAGAVPGFADDPIFYGGAGWAQRIDGLDPAQTQVVALENCELTGNHLPETAILEAGGDLTINRDTAEHAHYLQAATGVVAMAVVQDGGNQRLVVSDGSDLFEIVYNGGGAGFSALEIDGAQSWGGSFLRGVTTGDSPATAGVLVIPSDGSQVRHVTYGGAQWQATTLVQADAAFGAFHQADILDWDGVERLAAVSDAGLEILELANAQPVKDYDAPPDDALLAVIPAQNNLLGQDLLCWHRAIGGDAEEGWIMGLFVLNAAHLELLFVDSFEMKQIPVVDFLEEGESNWSELVLSHPTLHTIYFARQEVPVGGGPIFVLDLQSTAAIDMNAVTDGSVPPGGLADEPAVVASGGRDMDGDGDADLVATTRENFLCLVPSDAIDAIVARPDVISTPSPSLAPNGADRLLSYVFQMTRPSQSVVEFEYSIYHRPSQTGPLDATPVADSVRVDLTGDPVGSLANHLVQHTVGQVALLPDDFESFVIQARYVYGDSTSSPAITRYWTPDGSHFNELHTEQLESFKWYFGDEIGGGTVEGPRVQPYGGGGG